MVIQIPHTALDKNTLFAVIEEFVTRDGTDLQVASLKIDRVLQMLEEGKVVLVYDEESETCNIVSAEHYSIENR
ncbi:MAG: cytoplasmic protein [Waddliaceae bacterium]|nr:cytoplasmic protein [Waddliaceae bacterium]